MKIIFMGSPEISVPSLRALQAAGHEMLCVVTQPDKPKGRGQKVEPPAVKVAAQALELKVLQPNKIKDSHFISQLESMHPDFICVVAYGKILPPEILKIPQRTCLNLHFSLLPKYRGASCIAYALINGDEETGVTTILMDEGMDTGPILMQWTEPILLEDTADLLAERLSRLGAQQLVKTVAAVAAETIQAIPQNDAQASLAPFLKKEMGQVDWSKSAEEIFNLYRGLTPWPGLFSFLQGKRVLITKVRLVEAAQAMKRTGELGLIFLGRNGEMYVQCGSGSIEVLQLKPEGKKVLTAEEFVRGLHQKENLRFTKLCPS